MEVTLSAEQIKRAAICGAMRRIRALQIGRSAKHKCDFDGAAAVDADMEGCMCELAAALALNVSWPGEHDTPDYPGDLQIGVHVRGTKYPTGRLILHDSDPDEIFILVCGQCPTYNVVGYTFADLGKQDKFLSDPTGRNRHAYFVPQSELFPIETLREFLSNT